MDPKEKQKLLILFGIVGLAGLVFYHTLLLKPQFSKFIARNREFYAVSKRVKEARTLIANEEGIKRQLAFLKKQSELTEKRLPGQDEISSLLEEFSSIAESSGVKILKIKPMESFDDASQAGAAGGGVYSDFPILIEAKAGYHQCGRFVNELENMDTFIRIDDISIKGNPQDVRHHDIRLKLRSYIMK